MKRIKTLIIPLTDFIPARVHVAIGKWEDCRPWFAKRNLECNPPPQDCAAFAMHDFTNGKNFGIWLSPPIDFQNKKMDWQQKVAVISHETIHITWFLERAFGDLFCQQAQETQCYIAQSLIQTICYWLSKKPKKTKKRKKK